ncbi:MAG TPA: ATP synthase F0 subunit B [Terriglobales bacterium]|nr:ATP synthase F0 subunit B [Terriglobales bacterium]
MKTILRSLFLLSLLSSLAAVSPRAFAQAQDQSSAAASTPGQKQAEPEHKSIGGEPAKEEREAAGAEEEENANLKHSPMVQKLAKLTGVNVHQAHLVAMVLNFAIIVFVVVWFGRKALPGMLRDRNESIQRALEEARAASQEANRRLSEIENRLRQLDVEIGQIQVHAEKEAEAEEGRIKSAAEEDIRKVVEAAEQEIAAAAKLARRELTSHTADLAIALARKQIHVDSKTDQVLVRNFASKLSQDGGKDGN